MAYILHQVVGGKAMMDRNAPEALRDTAERGYRETKDLIQRWHGRGRIGCAITPRFAITSTEAQLEACGALAREHPDCHVQTHMNENRSEIETVLSLFPDAKDYLAVYERFGLVRDNTVLGHCIHMSDSQWARMGAANAVYCHCQSITVKLLKVAD